MFLIFKREKFKKLMIWYKIVAQKLSFEQYFI